MTSPLEVPPSRLVISIDLKLNGVSGTRNLNDGLEDEDTTLSEGRSRKASRTHLYHQSQTHPGKPEVVTPKQLILCTSDSQGGDQVGTRLAEIPAEHRADASQNAEIEKRLFRMPDEAPLMRRGNLEDVKQGSCAVVNLSGFFARQAARARPIFSPKFDRNGRQQQHQRMRRGWQQKASHQQQLRSDSEDPNSVLPAPREILSLASLDVATASNGIRSQDLNSLGGRRRIAHTPPPPPLPPPPPPPTQLSQTSQHRRRQQYHQQKLGTAAGSISSPGYFAPANCTDIVKRRTDSPASQHHQARAASPLRIRVDLQQSEAHGSNSARSCPDDLTSSEPPSATSSRYRLQHQQQQHHQLSELFSRQRLTNRPTDSVSTKPEQQQQQQRLENLILSSSEPSQQQFKLAEPRLKLSHFAGSKNPNAFFFLNSRMHIHTP